MRRVLLFIISITVLGLTGCHLNNENLVIKSFHHPNGVYFCQEKVSSEINILNPMKNEKEVWVEFEIKDNSDNQIDSSIQKETISSEKETHVALDWTIPVDFKSGSYKTEIIVWDKSPENSDAKEIAQSVDQKGFLIFKSQDDFNELDGNVWLVSEGNLGRSELKSENVTLNNGLLSIEMPQNTLNGGEIYSKELKDYGAFETRMKLPDAPSSITGFFLYKAPDYFYEIDIEVYNQSDGNLMLTTYSDGEKKNVYSGNLDFDPTKDFHDYRIEYQKDHVAFYIDNIFIQSWSDGFPKEGMYLMINCWYPKWLDGEKPKENQYLLVDWIRF